MLSLLVVFLFVGKAALGADPTQCRHVEQYLIGECQDCPGCGGDTYNSVQYSCRSGKNATKAQFTAYTDDACTTEYGHYNYPRYSYEDQLYNCEYGLPDCPSMAVTVKQYTYGCGALDILWEPRSFVMDTCVTDEEDLYRLYTCEGGELVYYYSATDWTCDTSTMDREIMSKTVCSSDYYLYDYDCPVTTTEAPTTEAPTTEAPTTEAPTTEAPTTEAPTTEAPTTEAPTTEAPTTEAPVTTENTRDSALRMATTLSLICALLFSLI